MPVAVAKIRPGQNGGGVRTTIYKGSTGRTVTTKGPGRPKAM
jgi:hypothetical protein